MNLISFLDEIERFLFRSCGFALLPIKQTNLHYHTVKFGVNDELISSEEVPIKERVTI